MAFRGPKSQGTHGRGHRSGQNGQNAPRGREPHRQSQENYMPRSRLQSSQSFKNRPGVTQLSPYRVQNILETTLSKLDRFDFSAVNVLSNWATEAGLAWLREIVESDFARSYSVTRLMFDPHCILFLRLISYISSEDIQTSLVLERSVGTIFNVIYGPRGDRAVTFLRRVVDYLSTVHNRSDSMLLHVTEAILSILLQVQEATFNSELKVIAETLWSCFFVDDAENHNKSPVIRLARENVLKTQAIFYTGDSVAANMRDMHGVEIKKKHPQPPQDVDLPGKLSQFGIRHDNDHATILDINILPTLSEIWTSRRPDFLPTRDALYSPDRHLNYESGIRRLLDSHFRLLREDTSGVLRDSLRVILENWGTLVHGTRWQDKRKILRTHSLTPVRIYYGVQVRKVNPHNVNGMEFEVEFDQVQRARSMTTWKRKQFWRNTRGLNEGKALLALIDADVEDDISVILLQVSKRDIDPVTDENHKEVVRDLVSSGKRAMITLRLTSSPSTDDLDGIIHLAHNPPSASARPLILVEFPALLYNAFEGILRCMKVLYRDPRPIPFTDWLAPQDTYPREYTTSYGYKACALCSPAYLKGVTLDLSSISSNSKKESTVPITFSAGRDFDAMCEEISERTALDKGQARAMVSAFENNLALIQGPPGTGKSYVGIQIAKCLLANRYSLRLGPILCVCYTNHALDQFLQGLYDTGITRIVRIGNRSTSPLLEYFSIENYKRDGRIPRIPGHGRWIGEQQRSLNDLASKIGHVCERLQNGNNGIVAAFLKKRLPAQWAAIKDDAMEGDKDPIGTWVLGSGPGDLIRDCDERTIEQLLSVNKWTMKNEERKRLFEYWSQSAIGELSCELRELMQQHALSKQKLTSLFNDSDAQVFDQVDVVGVTTTGLANSADLVRSLRSKVLICEEAAEVLESHILTALIPSVQHAILIGDHLQLRPKISRRKLSAEYDSDGPKYNLDESLFERMANFRHTVSQKSIEGGDSDEFVRFPVAQLDHQRRMHPSIASLVRGTLYPNLCDHPITHNYGEIPGFKRRLFWLDHRNTEDPDDPEDPMQTKTNKWEAELVISVVKHLCKQKRYKPGEIAILTPYVGQLRLLIDRLEGVVDLFIGEDDLDNLDVSEPEEDTNGSHGNNRRAGGTGKLLDQVRIATVDNFQGDEATVVVVSLVRSNKFRNCGFLKTPNRINVLLSRAKHGMYIIGNADTASSVPMWSSVIRMLEDGGNIGPNLHLDCSRHPHNNIYVSTPEDFLERAPEGGCAEQCERRLPCGHTCTFKCHSNSRHNAVKCMKSCTRMKKCGHSCQQRCHERCGECTEQIPNVPLSCGHTASIECRYLCRRSLIKCMEVVTKRLPGCGHYVRVKCHEDISKHKCLHQCQEPLDCGHTCQRPCWECMGSNGQRTHNRDASCNTACGRFFSTCSHTCTQPCHPSTPCPPCDKPCEVRCRHNKCPKKCSEPCAPCAEKCGWTCIHRQNNSCNLPCAVPCGIIPCDKRCDKKLGCGHRCPSICGEECPDPKFCLTCGRENVLERIVSFITFDKYREINIDEDPCVFLSCGHFYTVSSLDGIMKIKKFYNVEPATGTLTSPGTVRPVMSGDSKVPGCPECRLPLRDIHRYNRIVKKALLDESTKRFIVMAHLAYKSLVDAVSKREMELVFRGINLKTGSGAAVRPLRLPLKKQGLQKSIDKFIMFMVAAEQPYGRVNDLLAFALAREDNATRQVLQIDEFIIQAGFEIRGQILQLRLTWALLWYYKMIFSDLNVDPKLRSELGDAVANQLQRLICNCRTIRERSKSAKLLIQEVEAIIYDSLFSLLSLSASEAKGKPLHAEGVNKLRNQVSATLQECDALLSENPATLGFLRGDIDKARGLLHGAAFYSFVSTEEKKQVYDAMASQFSGTGHWYYCRNHHPFTVGECGMPMEEARCPQCGAPVGGLNHAPAAGVTRALDIDEQFGDI